MCAFWRSIDIPVFRLIRWVTRMSCRRLVSSCDRRWADSSRCTTYRLICRRFMGRIRRECRSGCGCVFHLPRGSFGFLSEPTELGLFWVYGGFLGLHLGISVGYSSQQVFCLQQNLGYSHGNAPPEPGVPRFPCFFPVRGHTFGVANDIRDVKERWRLRPRWPIGAKTADRPQEKGMSVSCGQALF